MQNYVNLSGNSNIVSYEIGDTHIIVGFSSGKCTRYTYTYGSAGQETIETMKRLARAGQGLNSFISTNKPQYSKKS